MDLLLLLKLLILTCFNRIECFFLSNRFRNIPQFSIPNAKAISIKNSNNEMFVTCYKCKTAYQLLEDLVSDVPVRCSLCNFVWLQSSRRFFEANESSAFIYNPTKDDLIRAKSEGWTLMRMHLNNENLGLFVSNIPSDFEKSDLIDLFSEYGVTKLSLIRTEGKSKSYAFVNVKIDHIIYVCINISSSFRSPQSRTTSEPSPK